MNKRLPLLLSLLGVILLAVSLAYWILQLYQPPQRPLAAVPQSRMADPAPDAAATLFGGQPAVASATNYQLTGIVSAGRDSVAIIVADGAPPKALKVGRELSPGIKLAEVYPRYVMLSDGGVMKRVELAADAKAGAQIGAGPGGQPPGGMPAGGQAQGMLQQQAQPQPQPQPQPVAPAGNPMPANTPEPPMAPGAVQPQPQQQQGFTSPGDVGTHDNPPPANPNPIVTPGSQNPVQMPAPTQPGNSGQPQTQ